MIDPVYIRNAEHRDWGWVCFVELAGGAHSCTYSTEPAIARRFARAEAESIVNFENARRLTGKLEIVQASEP